MTDLLGVERDRLGKLLGMLGSDHDGEVAAAGRAADRLVREAGLTWREVLAAPQFPKLPSSAATLIMECFRLSDLLSDWELEFLRSIARRSGHLSARQAECLNRICVRLGVGRG
jgi:hypothetical protein